MSSTLSADVVEPDLNPRKRAGEDVESPVPEKVPFVRIKKRKYAILISYSGQGYLGLQRNPGMKTIEEDLLKAWLKAGVINEETYNLPKLMEFQRAARTDKGVSAIKQVLSAKLPLEICLDSINAHLPDQIRMLAVKRATKGFNCKGNCDARTYSYTMPSFALAPHSEPISTDFRLSPEIISKTNEVLQIYLGTHNYHNFTSKRKPGDPSSVRFMMSFACEEPEVHDGMEFITVKVKGQSFMLHQIRKMVGLAIAIVRGLAPESTISKAWEEERLDLPVAPATGLVLEEVHYDRYNYRFGKDGIHDAIEWSCVEDKLNEFKNKFIISSIYAIEKEEKPMETWLQTLPLHSFGVRDVHRHQTVSTDQETIEEEPENGDIKSDNPPG